MFARLWEEKLSSIKEKNFLSLFTSRERQSVRAGDGKRERERESQAGSEPNTGIEPTIHEILTWVEIKSQMLNQLSHPSAPYHHSYTETAMYML